MIFLSEAPQFASLVSQEAITQIADKENKLTSHENEESTNGCKERGDNLLKSAMTLSHASSVAIVTWPRKEIVMETSDRQFAAVACIVKSLLAQEKEITILVAESNAAGWQRFLAKCEAEKFFPERIPVMSVAMTASDWSRDVRSAMHEVIDYLGPSFRSTCLNSVIFVNEQGKNLNWL